MLTWVRLDCKVEGEYNVPFFTGSLIRGVIGYALKRVVCINPSYKCEECFSSAECAYYSFYEEKNVFHPYRLGVKLEANNLDFSFFLFEDAIETMPYILASVVKAFEEIGIGKHNTKMKIASISENAHLLYDGKEFIKNREDIRMFLEIDSFKNACKMEFIMPVRIKQNNSIASRELQLHTLIINIHNRYRQLKGLEPKGLGYKVHGEIVETHLKFVETQRYSNRQKTTMNMGGLMGTLRIKNLDKQSYIYLKIGEIIGVGKQSVFGLGSYILKEER